MTERQLLPLLAADAGCTLPTGELGVRLGEWRAALAGNTGVSRVRADRLVVELGPVTDLPSLARLCELEVGCCSFFMFSLEVSAGVRRLVVTTPVDRANVLDEFGSLLAG